ncbi:MAG TPA: hypothetical protein V6C72_18690 [Chroococcales cyanobacterium]
MRRSPKGSALIESIVGIAIIFVPLVLFATDLAVMFQAAHANEEFAEQLARLCSTVPDKNNAVRACTEVIRQYQTPPNVISLYFSNLEFDLGTQQVSLTTTMVIKMPVPFPGYDRVTVSANAVQPIVSIPVPP